MMKIIGRDNYNRDNVSDVLIAEGLNEHYAEEIAELLNDHGRNPDRYYKAVADDHVLYKWEP